MGRSKVPLRCRSSHRRSCTAAVSARGQCSVGEAQRLWRKGAMTESNPVSLDMVLFHSSPSPDKKETSSGSACRRQSREVPMTQLDASDDEDVINPEPMALQTAFETPPRSRRAIVVQDFTPEGKIRPRESQALGTPCTGRPRRSAGSHLSLLQATALLRARPLLQVLRVTPLVPCSTVHAE